MKTASGWFHLRGLFVLSAAFICGLVLCSSAVAGSRMYRETTPDQRAGVKQKLTQKKVVYYVLTSASAIPKPVSYVVGGIMTTATPVQIIGHGE